MTPGISHESSVATPQASSNWLSHTWRLTSWNLKIARRRLMSKILLAILLGGFLPVLAVVLLAYAAESTVTTTTVSPPCPTVVATGQPGNTGPGSVAPPCDPNSVPPQQQQSSQNADFQLLTFPAILIIVGSYTGFMGVILLCILAGALIGNEYSFGTQRLALSRGVSRAQLLAGQVAALAILALAVVGFMLIIGSLAGFTIGPLLGGSIPAIPADGLLQILGFWLVISLQLFAYSLIALLLATLGRSTAAGIAGSLGYVLFEIIALPIVALIAGALIRTSFGDVLEAMPDFFLGPNISGLLSGVNQSPLDLGGGTSSGGGGDLTASVINPGQGLLVSLLYCVLLAGLSYWALRKRDVTH
ncbi:MAG TPA: ABC transporter permease subunit [Ktedonobacterales bacterium]|jgi:ABC-type transport system involved in multi-copper enzyme maturation permease subunit